MKITQIEFTKHSDLRQEQRGIPRDLIRSAIKHGSQKSLPGKGRHGGIMRQFTYP